MDLDLFRKRFAPRWLIMTIDVCIVLFSLALAYVLRFDFDIPDVELQLLRSSIFLFLTVRIGGLVLSRTYAGVIRYTSTQDAARILRTCFLSTAFLLVAGLLRFFIFDKIYFLPISILLLEFFLTSFFLITFRLVVKLLYAEQNNPKKGKKKVILYGAGESGLITKRALDRDASSPSEVIAFIDDDRKKRGKKLEGVNIYSSEKLGKLLEENQVEQVISTMMHPKKENRQRILNLCLDRGIRVLDVPPVQQWINGELSSKQLRTIPLEDLLGRAEIELDETAIGNNLVGKRVLVSGAAGSIGSELVRQIARFSPESIILLDQAESPLHEISIEVADQYSDLLQYPVLADICNKEHLKKVIEHYGPQIIFHAAAYKHVPMIEENVSEGLRTNVGGTKNLVDLAIAHKVERFVMVSTDKAVNPTNVMGASKRIAELYVGTQEGRSETRFVTTRFGNVLGSSGSVIPRFKKQIEKGGPITVTHPEIERFFMTIPEACRLVLEAGAMGQGGEIFVFDMGESVKITELAEKMIQLSGLEKGKDIEISFTGLRPGEKIKEEVLADKENTLPTHNERILIAQPRQADEYTLSLIEELLSLDRSEVEDKVRVMKKIVPEFKSNNSQFEELDQ